ncbi:response regulator [Ornithinimicrobium sp. F0845]|uniref:response regulator n=1 Tax=Ornithinimicrobium sp. F0845 TaxID=2926412 RepID=UPI001FF57D5F|nr:response regulator [Ornithinimicrobium sp. F0845]
MSARVLVVDSDPEERWATCQAASGLGYRPDPAADGPAALAMLRGDTAYEIVLLELVMAQVDGCAVLSAMKADERLRDLPVIVVSRADEVEDIARSIALGATDHLTKPVRTEVLGARLRTSLASKRLRDVERDHLAQVRALTSAAVELQAGAECGDLSVLDPVAARDDDLGTLARVFRQMAEEIRSRETALREQVDRLTVELDRSRIGGQVAEVTGSESYRDLAGRAEELRRILREE